jgi:hypothetical protein
MSVALLAIDSVLLLGMIGVSLYGASALPPGAKVPMHFGPGAYNNWVPKSVGLVLWPVGGGVIYVILALSARSQQANGGSGLPTGLTIALVVILVTQVGALKVAISRGGRES